MMIVSVSLSNPATIRHKSVGIRISAALVQIKWLNSMVVDLTSDNDVPPLTETLQDGFIIQRRTNQNPTSAARDTQELRKTCHQDAAN